MAWGRRVDLGAGAAARSGVWGARDTAPSCHVRLSVWVPLWGSGQASSGCFRGLCWFLYACGEAGLSVLSSPPFALSNFPKGPFLGFDGLCFFCLHWWWHCGPAPCVKACPAAEAFPYFVCVVVACEFCAAIPADVAVVRHLCVPPGWRWFAVCPAVSRTHRGLVTSGGGCRMSTRRQWS